MTRSRHVKLALSASLLALSGSCIADGKQVSGESHGLTGADAIRVCSSWDAHLRGEYIGWQPGVCGTIDDSLDDLFFGANDKLEESNPRAYVGDGKLFIKMGDSPSDEALQELGRQGERLLDFIDDFYDSSRSEHNRTPTYAGFLGTIETVNSQQREDMATVEAQTTGAHHGTIDALWKRLDAIYAREVDPRRVVAVERLRRTEDLKSYIDVALTDVAKLRQGLTTVGVSFTAARAQEADVYRAASALAVRASLATLATMPSVQVAIDAWYDQTRERLDQLGADATVTADQADWVLSSLASAFDANADFLSANGLPRPLVDRDVGRALGNVAGYADLARSWVDGAHDYLLQGLELRKEALINLESDQRTRDTFAQNAQLKAATAFLDEANARIAEVSTAFPTTVRLRAPLVAERMNLLNTFLQLEPLCLAESLSTSTWRQTGCIALTRQFSRARTTLDRSIPALIKLSVSALRREAYDEVKLKAIGDALLFGNVRDAALAIDAALLSVDMLPSPSAQYATGTTSAALVARTDGAGVGHTSAALTEAVTRSPRNEALGHWHDRIRAAYPGFISALREDRAKLPELESRLAAVRAVEAKVVAAVADANLDESTLLASLDTIRNLPAGMRQGVVDTFADIRRSLVELDERVRLAGTTYSGRESILATALTSLAKTPGLSDAGESAFVPAYPQTPLPLIAVPELRLSAPSADAFTTLATTYADRILANLGRAVVNGQLADRALFASTVRAWRRNHTLLADVLVGREATAAAEMQAFSAQEARIGAAVSLHMDHADWFLDVPVSADTRALVDGIIALNYPRVAGSLKEAINRWSRSASEARLQEAMLAALGRIAALATPGVLDAGTRDLTERLLLSVFERTVSGARLSQGDIVQFCIAVTGRNACDLGQPMVPISAQMEAALKLPVADPRFWRAAAQGAPGGGARAAANLIDSTSDLTVANRMQLNARLLGPALYNLQSATGAQLNGIASKLGDSVVRTLGASLGLSALEDLHTLTGVHLVDPAAESAATQRGTSVKRLGSLAGKTSAAIASALTAAAFSKTSAAASEETWWHSDGSVIRLFPMGSAEIPTRPYLIKQISASPSIAPANMLCALTDTGYVVPNALIEAQKALSTWYRAPSYAGHRPIADELRELSAVWLARTRIDYAP